MIKNENITVSEIQHVMYVKKDNPPGKITSYTSDYGLPTHELIFRICGEVITDFDGAILKGKKFTIQYLPKGQGNLKYEVKTIDPGECIDVFFDSNAVLADTPFCIDISSPAEMKELFRKIYDIWLIKNNGYCYDAMAILYKILKKLNQEANNSQQENSHLVKLQPAIEYLNTSFCEYEIDLEHAASLCNMSYSYFRHTFSACLKVSPAKYVMTKKIEYAKELLSSRHYNVSEVSDIVGFKDVCYFSHVFKKITGISPSSQMRLVDNSGERKPHASGLGNHRGQ